MRDRVCDLKHAGLVVDIGWVEVVMPEAVFLEIGQCVDQ